MWDILNLDLNIIIKDDVDNVIWCSANRVGNIYGINNTEIHACIDTLETF